MQKHARSKCVNYQQLTPLLRAGFGILVLHYYLVTGGASGIGLGFTEQFLADSTEVIVCGVLDELAAKHPQVITKICDISDENEQSVKTSFYAN